jgi:DNA-binding transcriptional MerR regulator
MKKQPLYFKISQVSKILGVSPSSLRTWEQVGLIRPARSQGRYRLYTSADLEAGKRILHLRKEKGLNLAGVAHLLPTKESFEGKQARLRKSTTAGVSHHLLKLRRKQGYTLAQVARQAGVSISFLSAIERGRAKPSIATLQRLAVIYKTNVLSMFGAEDERSFAASFGHPTEKCSGPSPACRWNS